MDTWHACYQIGDMILASGYRKKNSRSDTLNKSCYTTIRCHLKTVYYAFSYNQNILRRARTPLRAFGYHSDDSGLSRDKNHWQRCCHMGITGSFQGFR